MTTTKYQTMRRVRLLINTDPQRRCYNGAHYSSELIWSAWSSLDTSNTPEQAARRLKFWRELNDYAISQQGESARAEFKTIETTLLSC